MLNAKDAMDLFNAGMKEKMEKDKLQAEFATFDVSTLAKMSNKDLATWQAKYPQNSPQYIIASKEWDRRDQKKERFTALQVAFIGTITTIIGIVLSPYIPNLMTPKESKNIISIQSKAGEKSSSSHTNYNPQKHKNSLVIKP